jgi:hypothetical protein
MVPPTTNHFASIDLGSRLGSGLQIANLEIEPVTLVSLQEALDPTELSFSGINGLAGVKSQTSTHDAVDAVLTPWSSGASFASTHPVRESCQKFTPFLDVLCRF